MDDFGTRGVTCCCDLHSHVLPGLDDGAPDSKVAQEMLKMAADSGTTELYATPHLISGSWQPTWAEILHRTETLNRYAAKTGLGVRVLPGAEVAMDWSLLDLLPTPGPYCLGGSRFILVELPLGSLPNYADDFLFTLQTRDFLPILAHPERNPDVKADPSCLQPWLDRGIFVQMNTASLLGRMGSRTQAIARTLIETGMVHFVGSDAHSAGSRSPDMQEARQTLDYLLGSGEAAVLLSQNPAQLLADRPEAIRPPHARPQPQKISWRSRLAAFWCRTPIN